MKITVQINPWTLPGPPTHFEGKPSPDELERERTAAEAAIKTWAPGPEAYALLNSLRTFVGKEVIIQGWDPIMFFLEDDGPSPIRATCEDVITREEDGHVRAYLVVSNPRGVVTNEPDVLCQLSRDGDFWLFGLDRLYEFKLANSRPCVLIDDF